MASRYCVKWRLNGIKDERGLEALVSEARKALALSPGVPLEMPPLDAAGFEWPAVGASDGADGLQGSFSVSVVLRDDQVERLVKQGLRVSVDPVLAAFDRTVPYASGSLFGRRAMAHRLIGAESLPKGADGSGVNVVIVDEGLNRAAVPRSAFAGGWFRYQRPRPGVLPWLIPGEGRSDHAAMVARNVLALAPKARIWDMPLLPESLLGPPAVSMAEAMFYYLWRDLKRGTRGEPFLDQRHRRAAGVVSSPAGAKPVSLPEGPWIVVNAWGVLDPTLDQPDGEDYATNPQHPFVRDMPRFGELENRPVDMIFAAGNCGEPTPMPRCGATWRGPGHSIIGVNAHPDVLTVGAVRVDGVPAGLSAQGPGALWPRWGAGENERQKLAMHKPDLCAPSGFCEDADSAMLNTGTSAAAGVMAGAVAALRSYAIAGKLPQRRPAELRALLRETARPVLGAGRQWDPRLGWGILDLPAALDQLGR